VRRTAAASPLEGVSVSTSLEEVMGWADHVVVAAAATAETRHLVGAGALAAAREGLHLVNVARGSLVDQEALRQALDAGRVARASLDTVEPEPLPEGHWMYAHPRVFLSAHISWSAPGSIEALTDAFADNLERWLAGEPLQHVVDVRAGY
jgi:phosphoglycerate dehydrogenase-like enzyme